MDKVGALGDAWSPLDVRGNIKRSGKRDRDSVYTRRSIAARSYDENEIDLVWLIVYRDGGNCTCDCTCDRTCRREASVALRTDGKRKRRTSIMMISGISIMKIAICILLGCCVMMRVTGSAIPMWEFLSRDEKVSTDHPSVDSANYMLILLVWRKGFIGFFFKFCLKWSFK